MPGPSDPFDLQRFLDAQRASYGQALAELRAGQKQTHWSWYIFPQVLGLGSSAMSVRYAIRSLAEARAYLAHPVLGARLLECIGALRAHAAQGAELVLGDIDAQKFRSCPTLFDRADSRNPLYGEALASFFAGRGDAATLAILDRQRGNGSGS